MCATMQFLAEVFPYPVVFPCPVATLFFSLVSHLFNYRTLYMLCLATLAHQACIQLPAKPTTIIWFPKNLYFLSLFAHTTLTILSVMVLFLHFLFGPYCRFCSRNYSTTIVWLFSFWLVFAQHSGLTCTRQMYALSVWERFFFGLVSKIKFLWWNDLTTNLIQVCFTNNEVNHLFV